MQERVEFGPFQLDRDTGRLTRHGVPLKLVGHPIAVLAALLERPGHLGTREELRRRLWGDDTYVDYEHGLNAAVNKLRLALRDTAAKPRYIETIPRRGYRFAAPVTAVPADPPAGAPSAAADPRPPASRARTTVALRARLALCAAAAAAAILIAAIATQVGRGGAAGTDGSDRALLLVLPFENLSGDRDTDFFGEGLADEVMLLLGQLDGDRIGVVARSSAHYVRHAGWRMRRIADELGVDYVVDGSVRRVKGQVRVTAQLTRARDEAQVWRAAGTAKPAILLGIEQELASALTDGVRAQLPGIGAPRHRSGRSPVPEAYEAYLRGRYLLGRRTNQALEKAHASLERAVRLIRRMRPRTPRSLRRTGSRHPAACRRPERCPRRSPPHGAAWRSTPTSPRRTRRWRSSSARTCGTGPRPSASSSGRWPSTPRRPTRESRTPRTCRTCAGSTTQSGKRGEPLRSIPSLWRAGRSSRSSCTGHVATTRRSRSCTRRRSSIRSTPSRISTAGSCTRRRAGSVRRPPPSRPGCGSIPRRRILSALLAYARARAGEPESAKAILRHVEAGPAGTFLQPPTVGLVHLALGNRDAALDWLERGYAERSWQTALINVNPEFDPLRGDPRFEALRRRMRFPE